MIYWDLPNLVMTHSLLRKNITFFHGKIHYISMVIFNRYVKLAEGNDFMRCLFVISTGYDTAILKGFRIINQP